MIPLDTLGKFRVIIEAVKEMFPGSSPVIGGGALRDSYHGRPIKDVDVFIRAADFNDLTHPNTKIVVPPFISEYVGRPDLHGVWNVTHLIEGYEVQLILADFTNMWDLADTFDLGMSRLTYDGTFVHITREFYTDSIRKEFRIIRRDSDHEIERSERRIDRLLLKYPEFTREVA